MVLVESYHRFWSLLSHESNFQESYSYRVKIINQAHKKESIVRELRHCTKKFMSITEMKVALMEAFEEHVPPTTRFTVGFFEGRQSAKRWIFTQEDLEAMYVSLTKKGQKTEICLWCDGRSDEEGNQRKKRKRDNSPVSKRDGKEREIEDLVTELKDMHKEHHDYTDPQYRLWARMIQNGMHDSKDEPPQIPMITGITPNRSKRKTPLEKESQSMQDTIVSTATAVVKALNPGSGHITQTPAIQQIVQPSTSVSATQPPMQLGLSPGKAADVRGKCLTQLAALKQLHDDEVLTDEELRQQKANILKTLDKL